MLLTTKFLRPTADPRSVQRERLRALLQPDGAKRLNLVVAPAGFGKTTLVSQWCSRTSSNVVWLSLDEHDDEPRRFWQYVVGAFEHNGLAGLEECRQQLSHCSLQELEGPITGLINVLAADGAAWSLILDDYHFIRDPQLQRQVSYFIDYLPPDVMITLASRTEPALPLSRWRVRRWVEDVHPGLLAFSEEECQQFFHDTMGLELSEQEVRKICRKTEGWVAAMQLSALSGGSIEDQSAGGGQQRIDLDERKISDYVLTEVLEQQPAPVRDFLLDTACCPRLCASLCDAVRGTTNSQVLLEQLLRENLFLIPLDTRNEWFRYHDLFRDALLQRARQFKPEDTEKHWQRAVNWLLTHGHVQEGISQIVQHRDWPWLARVLAEHGNNLIHGGFHLPVLSWLDSLPVHILQESPQLLMLRVWALFFANRVDVLDPLLDELEDMLDKQVADSHPDAEGALGLQSEISLIRSYLARSKSDDKSASDLTQQVLRDIDHTRIPLKSVTYYGVGLDYYGKGDLAAAEDALKSAVRYGELERKPSTVLSSGGLLAWIQYNRGDIDEALDTCTRVRQWVDQHHSDPRQPMLISCWQNSALIEIYRERNEPQLAASYLAPLLDHVNNGTEPGQHVIIQYVRGHLAFSEGRYQEAIEALEDAASVARRRRDHILFEPPACSAMLARCYLATGHLTQAEEWMHQVTNDRFTNPLNREQNQISVARVQVALGHPEAAMATLAPLRLSAEKDQHYRHLVEIQLVYSDALYAEGKTQEADQMLARAVQRAADAGFMRLLAEESPSIRKLCLELPLLKAPGRWNSRVLGMLREQAEADATASVPTPASTNEPTGPADSGNDELAEPLSQRELEVLELINQGLANKDIASTMGVAPTTVKAHIRNLYGKLAVGSRTEALARARELRLLA
ncbi:LuxR C-terminal-related transcriptional regulator [Marinobacter sp. SS13-12]|uniref:LuxR C-terminal-related transcriptional regulator n=1 Tax=Marinobacter sp. SS13-12 TaxID=3050451 RepID=UPI0025527EAA|nr:LuxR C-terminal-related transcriptional regulator [Marinobacter sp. SS13-12]MDK8464318.1 LuxR C-terminal-related transcriptional regulator [Marinobacter sp. SS13-12]